MSFSPVVLDLKHPLVRIPQGLVVEAYQAIVTALQVDPRYSHLVDGRLADLRSTRGDADILRLQRWHDALSDAYIQAAQVCGSCVRLGISGVDTLACRLRPLADPMKQLVYPPHHPTDDAKRG